MEISKFFNHFNSNEMKEMSELINKFIEMILTKFPPAPNEQIEEHSQYSREKRLFIGKILNYRFNNPELRSKEVNWDEFILLFADNAFLRSSMLCLQAVLAKMDKMHQTYHAIIFRSALMDYENTRKNFETGKAAYEKKFNELTKLLKNIKGAK